MENYAIDIVDDRDYDVETLLGSTDNLPNKKVIWDDEIQNQSLHHETRNACVYFTGSSVSNTMNYINWESQRISWKSLSKIAHERGLLDLNKWAWVVWSPQLLLSLWYITAFARAKSLNDIKIAINDNKPVQCPECHSTEYEETIDFETNRAFQTRTYTAEYTCLFCKCIYKTIREENIV